MCKESIQRWNVDHNVGGHQRILPMIGHPNWYLSKTVHLQQNAVLEQFELQRVSFASQKVVIDHFQTTILEMLFTNKKK